MNRKRSNLLSPVLIPNIAPLLFLGASILFAVLGNAVYDLFKLRFSSPVAISLLAIFIIGALLLFYQAFRRYWRPTLDSSINTRPRRGLVVLMSPGNLEASAAVAAVRYHYRGENDERDTPTLEHCWLVTSPSEPPKPAPDGRIVKESGTAWANANELKTLYQDRIVMHIVEIDPNDPEDVYEKVAGALREAERNGLAVGEVGADFTGGTKPMSVGMALAATTMGRSLEYMKARAHDESGRAIAASGSDPVALDLQFVFGSDLD